MSESPTRRLALVLTAATGAAALAYEVAWQKYLAILLGSHSEATAAVLGLFLAGLAVGYALFGAITRRRVARAARGGPPARLLALYAAVEASIGAYALCFPALFAAVRALSAAVPHAAGGWGFAFDVALTALLIGPPTVAMGGTIPILTQALARSLADATRIHARIYAWNTAGAFAGALLAGLVLVPWLGLVGVLFAASVLNLGAAAVFAALARRAGEAAAPAPEAPAGALPARGLAGYAAVACATGFGMMALQAVAIRVGGLALGASPFTFALVVAVFVLCIALGSAGVSLLSRVPAGVPVLVQWGLALAVLALYPWLGEAPYWVHLLRGRFGLEAGDFAGFQLGAFALLLMALGPAATLSGAVLPLLFHRARERLGALGDTAGRLYAWNTAGSLLGALLAGYALFFWLDLHAVYRVAVGVLLAAAGGLTGLVGGRRAPVAGGVAALALLGLLVRLEPWDPRVLASGLFRYRTPVAGVEAGPLAAAQSVREGSELVFHRDDPVATITVNQWRPGPDDLVRSILNNGKPDGTTRDDYPTMALAAALPALFSEKTERAFVIGWGTGITAGELQSFSGMREVVVAEISPAVLEAAPLFDFASLAASRSPRVRAVRSDAYRALLRSEGLFDVIVSEPSNPWMAGVEMLYSREFLEAARARLAPGGVYVQWYHQYETDPETVELVLRTYAGVFPELAVWFGRGPDLLLLGFGGPERAIDLERVLARSRRSDLSATLARCGVEDAAALLAHELLPLGAVHALGLRGPVHTLSHPRLGHRAARAFFAGRNGALPDLLFSGAEALARERSLLGRHLAEAPGPEERVRRLASATREACRHRPDTCLALLASWRAAAPGAPESERLLEGPAPPIRVPTAGVRALADLLLGSGAGAPLTLAEARRLTTLVARAHHPALALGGDHVVAVWERCRDEGDLCEEALVRARTLTGQAP